MVICYICGEKSYIKYDNHFVCRKHYNLAINQTFKEAIAKNEKDNKLKQKLR
jgi:hypothetical protein